MLRQASHQGTSQDGNGYPRILSIQGLGWSGRPAIRGHPRMVLGRITVLDTTFYWGHSEKFSEMLWHYWTNLKMYSSQTTSTFLADDSCCNT